jgi:hypothetical protein
MWFALGIFLLVLIDDYLLMAIIMALVVWDTRRKNLKKRNDQHSLTEGG